MAARRRRLTDTPVVAVSGFSGAGKTRLLSRLIPALARRGVVTAVVKHTGHRHALDRPGKDTEVLRRAGAIAAAIEGPDEMAFFGPPAGGLAALVRLLPPADLVLAEGWKEAPVPRIEVHRRKVARAFLCGHDRRVFAVVTDEPPPRPVAVFGHGDVEALAELVCTRLHLGGAARKRARLRVGPAVSRVRAEESGRTVAPRRREDMVKTTKRKIGSSRGGSRPSGRKGGRTSLKARGSQVYSETGRRGGKGGSRRRVSTRRPTRKAGGSRSRGAARSRRATRSTSR